MKWVEAIPIPFKNVNNEIVIKMKKDNLIHRFGIQKIIIADQGRVFTGDQVKEFANMVFVEMIHSTPLLRLMDKPSLPIK
jgi:hypothetical protein